MNILIPMAGSAGSFKRSNFKQPKYLIDINGFTILERSLRGLDPISLFDIEPDDLHYYFIVRKDQFKHYGLRAQIHNIIPDATILTTEYTTDGQACTALWAEAKVGNDDPLLIIGPDQLLKWDPNTFLTYCEAIDCDASVVVTHNMLSGSRPFRVNVDKEDRVHGIYEKKKRGARYYDCGIYYFKFGWYFTLFCKQMISRDTRAFGEFHVAPTMNEAVVAGKYVSAYKIEEAGLFHKPVDVRTFIKKKPDWVI